MSRNRSHVRRPVRSPAKTLSARIAAVPLLLIGCWLEAMVPWVEHAEANRAEHRRNIVGFVLISLALVLLLLAAQGPDLALAIAGVALGFGLFIEALRLLARALVRLLGPHLL